MNEPPPIPSEQIAQAQVEAKTSKTAIWSLVFGVASFCLSIFGFIPALILGILALIKINASQGQLKGAGLAVAGMVTGGLGLFVAAILAAMALPAFNEIQQQAKIVRQEGDVKILVLACYSYAADNNGRFPETLQGLHPDYLDDQTVLKFYNSSTQKLEPYMYFSGKSMKSEPRSLLIASPVEQKNMRVVGFCDTSVEKLEITEFYRLAELESGGG